MSSASTRVLVSIGLIVVSVGAVDSVFSREWDLLVVFLLSFSLHLILWLRTRANRIPVTLRPDLTRWLEHQSERSGEPFDDVLDRAVAWYQHGLYTGVEPVDR